MSHTVIQPENWAKPRGYANGILTADKTLYVAGQIGWNELQEFKAHDFIGQADQALGNVVSVVEAAKGTASDIVRMTWYITDKKAYLKSQQELGEVYRRIFGLHYPAMSMFVVNDLIDDEALLEIEATAQLRAGRGQVAPAQFT